MEIKDIVGWIVAIIVAIIGISAVTIKIVSKKGNSKNTINQTIEQGNGNIQAGGDVNKSRNDIDEV